MAWFGAQGDYLHFFCASALLLLSLFCWRGRSGLHDDALPLGPLALGALAEALVECAALTGRALPGTLAGGLSYLLRVLSLLCLIEAGRRLTPRLARGGVPARLYALFAVDAVAFAAWGLAGLGEGLAALVALAAAAVVGGAGWRSAAAGEVGQRPAGLAALLVAVYAVVSALAVLPLPAAAWPSLAVRGVLALVACLACSDYLASLRASRRSALYGRLFLGVVVLLTAGGALLVDQLGRVAGRRLQEETFAKASVIATLVNDDLNDIAQVATLLGGSPPLRAALAGRQAPSGAVRTLTRYGTSLDIGACWLVDRNGRQVDASAGAPGALPAALPQVQHLVAAALAGRSSTSLAAGTPGLARRNYAAAPVPGDGGSVAGAVVVSRDLDYVEAELRKYPYAFVVSPAGVVLLASREQFLHHPLWPPTPGAAPAAALLAREPAGRSYVRLAGEELYACRLPLAGDGGSLALLAPTAIVTGYRLFGIVCVFAVLTLLSCCFFVLISYGESKELAARLCYANDKWQRTFDAVPDLLVVTGPDARVRNMNRAMAQRLGVDRLAMTGLSLCNLLDCGQDGRPACPHRQLLETGSAACGRAGFYQRLNGVFTVSVAPILAADGAMEAAVHVLQDVTEQSRLEQSLRDTAERLALATEGSNDATWEWNMATNEGYLNERYYEMTGYRPGEIEPAVETFLAHIHPGDRDRVLELIKEHLEGERAMFVAEYRLVTKSGRIRQVMGRGRMVRPLIMAGMITDITEYKRLADEVNRSRHLESIGILAGGLAHDFNNVLNVVDGNVSFARMLCEEGSPVAAALADAEQGCESAKELGNRLRMLAQEGDPCLDVLRLDELVGDALQAAFRGDAIAVAVTASPGDHLLVGDLRQLGQLFDNLFANSRDTMPGGGNLSVCIGSEQVDGRSELPLTPGRYLCVVIADDGDGIAADDLPRIFDPYFSTKECYREKGVGLGLPICYAIAKRHRGHITLASRQGAGTTVTVYLPAAGE